jgi:hypothetical protein
LFNMNNKIRKQIDLQNGQNEFRTCLFGGD